MDDAPLHGDLGAQVAVDTAALDWAASPSRSVWRKRLHRVGPAESGQVTSVVRYEPDSRFPAHDHPEGEEILVLTGTFSDEHGDWPAGTYLLNPEGFRHAPFSREGCELFVKLRQLPGREREHVVVDTQRVRFAPGDAAGVETAPLYAQDGFSDRVDLERWAPGSEVERRHAEGAELFVLEGALEDESGRHGPQAWLRLPPGSAHSARTGPGCRLYVKRGGFPYLRPGKSPA